MATNQSTKPCIKCRRDLPASMFYRNVTNICDTCRKAISRANYLARRKPSPSVRSCRHCGEEYTWHFRSQKYCGESCRFWAKVDRTAGHDGCWLWKSKARTHSGSGYGAFRNADGSIEHASRAAWRLTNGPAGDLHVLHKCDNPICCNPAHLFLGSHTDNMADMTAKGRNWVDAAHIEKLRLAKIGKKRSPETIRKMVANRRDRIPKESA